MTSATPRLPKTSQGWTPSSRRPPLAAQRRAPPSIRWGGAQVFGSTDAFVPADTGDVSSSARTSFGPTPFAHRRRRQLDVPENLQGTLAPGTTFIIETEQADNGEVDVVDCELIASRHELKRWRLSLTDFHALIAGGTESIEAYRQEQRRRDQAVAQGAQRAQELAAAAAADALEASAAPPSSPQKGPEPLWRRAAAWPYRALKRLLAALLRLIG